MSAQRIGLSLEEIGRELSKLPHDRAPTRRDWSTLSSKWTARIDERIADDRAAHLGPGPRYWVGDRPIGG